MKQTKTAGTVLVVDSDAGLRRAICTIFARVGIRTREAETGVEALRAVAQESPLLALLEVCLDDISGYEVCHEIKQSTAKRVPVILMSARRTDPLDRVAGLLIGADDYLAKPFDPDELLIRTRKLIERSLPSESPIMATLTPREREILCLLADWPGRQTVIPTVDGRLQYACARYGSDALERAEIVFAAGERSLRCAGDGDRDELSEAQWRAVGPANTFADVDTPADLRLLGLS